MKIKKLLLLPLLFMLFSCSKDDDIDLIVNDLILGEWKMVSYKGTTYNKTGAIHNRFTPGFSISYNFDRQNYTMYAGSSIEKGPYQIIKRNGKDYITFTDKEVEGKSEIASISANKLFITIEFPGDGHPQAGSEYRTVIVQEFERPR